MLGVGEPHGKNAVKWLVDNLEQILMPLWLK